MTRLDLPFDQYQRYKIVEELIDSLRGGRSLNILDVGGYPGLAWDFLPRDNVLVLDKLPWDKEGYVQGDGTVLPFADSSFDLVMSIDVLEHLCPEARLSFLEEQIRVTTDYIVLVAPFADENVELSERIVNEFLIKRIGYRSDFLKEHLDNGLPDLTETLSFLHGRDIQYLEIPNGYLFDWLVMMVLSPLIQMMPNSEDLYAAVNRFYNSNFYPCDNREPSYRKAILASKRRSLDRERVLENLEKARPSAIDASVKMQLLSLLLYLRIEEPRMMALQKELDERTAWALELERELVQARNSWYFKIFGPSKVSRVKKAVERGWKRLIS